MSGAATSDVDFEHLFQRLQDQSNTIRETPAEPIDTSDTIVEKARAWTRVVSAFLPQVPDYVIRLGVAIL